MILCSIPLATKSGILFVESEIHFFTPQELWNVIQSEAEQAERSKAKSERSEAEQGEVRRSSAERGITFQSKWGSKKMNFSRDLRISL